MNVWPFIAGGGEEKDESKMMSAERLKYDSNQTALWELDTRIKRRG